MRKVRGKAKVKRHTHDEVRKQAEPEVPPFALPAEEEQLPPTATVTDENALEVAKAQAAIVNSPYKEDGESREVEHEAADLKVKPETPDVAVGGGVNHSFTPPAAEFKVKP